MKNLLLIILTIFFLTGCKKYLDYKPDNSLAIPKTYNDFSALLKNPDVFNYGSKGGTPNYGEVSCDDYFLPQSTIAALRTPLLQIYTFQRPDNADEITSANDWFLSYAQIYYSNLCLENVQPSSDKKWEELRGQALFYRSHNFLNLVWNHGKAFQESSSTDPGIVLRSTTNYYEKNSRATVKQCYERIIEDTKEAAKILPDLPENVFLPSRASSYGLLARTYLSMREYDSAYKYADLCLEIKNYLLDYNNVNLTVNNPFTPFAFSLTDGEVIYYTEMNTTLLGNYISASGGSRVDTTLYQEYENDDLRKIGFFQANGTYHNFKGTYGKRNYLFTGFATNEMYLIRAECRARLNNTKEALDDLNHLLRKRYTPNFVPLQLNDQGEILKRILLERRKELLFRGLRWIDIKRLNLEGYNISTKRNAMGTSYELAPNSDQYSLPLPERVVRLGGIPDNLWAP